MAAVSKAARVRPAKLVLAVDETPPLGQLIALGVQFAAIAAIYFVLVAIVIRSARVSEQTAADLMSIACIAAGIGTLLQVLPRGPIGSGYLTPPAYSATYLAPCVIAAQTGGMPLVFGMTIAAGVAEMIIALFLTRLRIVITPVISGLSVFIVGLQLGLVGIAQFLDVPHESLTVFPYHLAVTGSTLAVCVGLSIWGTGSLKLLCSFYGLIVGALAAIVVGIIGSAEWNQVTRAAWVTVPSLGGFGLAFDWSLLPAFLAATVGVVVRSIALITTCQRQNDEAWERPDMVSLRKGVLADGLSNVVGGLLGAQGMNVSASAVGISSTTGVASRIIGYPSAAILIAMGFMPKLAVFFLFVPPEVAGTLIVFTCCFMIAGGMEIMLSSARGPRANYVIGIATLLALSESAYPKYFSQISPGLRNFIGNPLAFGMTAAIALSLLFRIGTRQRDSMTWSSTPEGRKAAVDFTITTAKRWNIAAKTAEAAAAEIGDVIGRLADLKRLDRGGELRLTTDGLQFKAEVRCQGARYEIGRAHV